jgi:hypothetical protein
MFGGDNKDNYKANAEIEKAGAINRLFSFFTMRNRNNLMRSTQINAVITNSFSV